MITISTLFYAFLMVFAGLGLVTTVMGIGVIFLIVRASISNIDDEDKSMQDK